MAGKPWYMKLEASKVLADGGLAICSLAARGAWMWLLMRMHADGATGVWEGTRRQFALLVGAIDEPIDEILHELRGAGVGDFEDLDDGRIRIVSRRMKREADVREKDRERKAESHSISDSIPEQFQTISDPFSDSDYNSLSEVTEIAEREDEEPRARTSKSIPSDAEQVRMYALMVHLPDFSEKFFHHYESVGWRHGPGEGKPIRSWQSRYRIWCEEQRERDMKAKTTGSTNGTHASSRPAAPTIPIGKYRDRLAG